MYSKCLFLLFSAVIASFSTAAIAGGKTTAVTFQTLPSSSARDYRAPAYITSGNVTYKTLPASNIRDYRSPAFITKDGKIYQTLPASSIIDYRAPSYQVGQTHE